MPKLTEPMSSATDVETLQTNKDDIGNDESEQDDDCDVDEHYLAETLITLIDQNQGLQQYLGNQGVVGFSKFCRGGLSLTIRPFYNACFRAN